MKEDAVTHPELYLPPSLLAARSLLAELIAQGVRHVVISPGSRSAPLAYAAYCAQEAAGLNVHIKVDERSAGFFALGLAKASGVPAAVVTTSGTAVANLHPAVLEAHHSGVPMIVLSADRPHELRGTGANQTTDQMGIFGTSVRLAIDLHAPVVTTSQEGIRSVVVRAVAAATGMGNNHCGPVQINCGFADPLAPTAVQLKTLKESFRNLESVAHTRLMQFHPGALGVGAASNQTKTDPVIDAIDAEPHTVVIAGDGAPVEAGVLAQQRGWPLLAEPSSNQVELGIAHGPLVLDQVPALVNRVTQVIVFGRPTLTRQVQRLMASPTVKLVIVEETGAPFIDPSRTADMVIYGLPQQWRSPEPETEKLQSADARWLEAWTEASEKITVVLNRLRRTDPTFSAQLIAQQVADASVENVRLVVGSSSVIRDLDLYANWPGPVPIHANRGLAGIDGTISTALGIATESQKPVRVIMGDLTFLHDIGGLLRGPKEAAVDLDIIVFNDGGGAIFAGLEHGRAGDEELFTQMFTTPHSANLGQLCAGYNVAFESVAPQNLHVALKNRPRGIAVFEVLVDSSDRKTARQRLDSALKQALIPGNTGNSQ